MIDPHVCDERCVCVRHDPPLPLLYSRSTREHACQDSGCMYADGWQWEFPRPLRACPPREIGQR